MEDDALDGTEGGEELAVVVFVEVGGGVGEEDGAGGQRGVRVRFQVERPGGKASGGSEWGREGEGEAAAGRG